MAVNSKDALPLGQFMPFANPDSALNCGQSASCNKSAASKTRLITNRMDIPR